MAITNGYATLAQVKAALRITDSVDDPLLEMAIESGSRAIDDLKMAADVHAWAQKFKPRVIMYDSPQSTCS